MIADLYGIVDLIMQLNLCWVQFLKCLSLTDLDQDSEKKHMHILLKNGCIHKVHQQLYKNIELRIPEQCV